jgi:hypothetical protein
MANKFGATSQEAKNASQKLSRHYKTVLMSLNDASKNLKW